MATHKLALIIENPSNDAEFLLLKQSRPPKFDDAEYDSFVDSDLWDLPSVQLNPLQAESEPHVAVEVAGSHLEEFNWREFDVRSALNEVVFLNFGRFFMFYDSVMVNSCKMVFALGVWTNRVWGN